MLSSGGGYRTFLFFLPHVYTSFKCTDRQTHSAGGKHLRFFDVCRYHSVMMSYGRGGEAWSKKRGRDEDARKDIQDNNRTKMATAFAMGRPLASRRPNHQRGPNSRSERVLFICSNRMDGDITRWNHYANLSHHCRRASTVSPPSFLRRHQTFNPQHPDVWLLSLHPMYLPWVAVLFDITFYTHFSFFLLSPFIMVFWLLI